MAPPRAHARPDRRRKRPTFTALHEHLEVRVVPATLASASVIAPSVTILPDGGNGAPTGFTPQQIRAAYGFDQIRFGSIAGDGGGQTIAIVDAYDDPGLVDSSAANFSTSDLALFDRQFNLPDPPSFTKIDEAGDASPLPDTDPAGPGSSSGNWEYEEAMDVEWAHALAPAASIVLVETDSSSTGDLYSGINIAEHLSGVSTISVSWGSSEFAGETDWDQDFTTPSGHQGISFVAAAGDGGSPGIYPAYSPNVVAAGGTTLQLNPDGSIQSQSAWSHGGGGTSGFGVEPAYQQVVQDTGYRTIPDVSFLADRSVGVSVYDSYDNTGGGPWTTMGGTSLAAPAWAALIAVADQGRVAFGGTTLDGATQTLPALYSLPSADFYDITGGGNGTDNAGPGYDEATGLGTPVANLLAPDLAFYEMADHLAITAQSPASTIAGQPFGLTVAVENPDGTIVPGASGTVTLALAGNAAGTALNGTLTATIEQGVATFTGLAIDAAGTGYSLTLSDGGLGSVTSSAFDVTPAASAQLVMTDGLPSTITAGGVFGLSVSVEDAFGNLATGFSGEARISVTQGPAGATVSGPSTVAVSQGKATFAALVIDKAGPGNMLTIDVAGVGRISSSPFVVVPAAPSQLAIVVPPPRNLVAGQGFGIAVAADDRFGNTVTGFDTVVALSLANGPAGGSLTGVTSTSAADGIATFNALALDRAGAGYQLQATSTGLTATTATTTVTPAAPSRLVITSQPPASVDARRPFAVAVAAEDAYGNVATSFDGTVSAALTSNPGRGTLGGTLAVPATQGLAVFSGLNIAVPGKSYTLTITSNGLTPAVTSVFDVVGRLNGKRHPTAIRRDAPRSIPRPRVSPGTAAKAVHHEATKNDRERHGASAAPRG